MPTTHAQQQTLSFKAEETKLLDILAHSLYSNPEIAFRELISNAADAIHKFRLSILQGAFNDQDDPDLKIKLKIDKDQKTITIQDNGIGMNRQELIDHLGTIANSGTSKFLKQLTGDQAKDNALIGRFGVGFYSAFVVADHVTVRTRRAGLSADHAVEWGSDGKGQYTLTSIQREERGTEVVLHLKSNDQTVDFLEPWRLEGIVRKYSDHIPVPISIRKLLPATEAKEDTTEKEDKAPEWVEEVINEAKALWMQPKKDIKDEDYQALYRHLTHDFEDALAWTHHKVEGKLEYISLLYIPQHTPFNLWSNQQKQGLKLYIQHTFIMEDAEQLLPSYLRFVKGVIDSKDLPLNVSREILQNSKVVDSIRQSNTQKILSLLEQLAENEPERYQTFWKNFGNVMKEALAVDYANRDRVAKLLRFASTHNNTEEQGVSFDDYIKRMQPDQDKIYYITADGFPAAQNSPHVERFRQQGVEVLLFYDPIDEWVSTHLNEYEGKKLQSVAKGESTLKTSDEATQQDSEAEKQQEEQLKSILEPMQKALSDRVKEVRFTQRLQGTDWPACLVVEEHDMSIQMRRLLKNAGQATPHSLPILELNAQHPLIQRLYDEKDDNLFDQWSKVLFSQAMLAEGGDLDDPIAFVKDLNHLLMVTSQKN